MFDRMGPSTYYITKMSIFRQPPPHIMLYNSTDPPQKLYNTRLDPAPLNQRAVKTHSMDTYYISCSKNVTPVIYTTNLF